MTCVDLRPEALELDEIVATPLPVRRPVLRTRHWWRSLAAVAVFFPGGGLAYDILTRDDD
jgi:hypothetical protein